jgi:hypothetical protein
MDAFEWAPTLIPITTETWGVWVPDPSRTGYCRAVPVYRLYHRTTPEIRLYYQIYDYSFSESTGAEYG